MITDKAETIKKAALANDDRWEKAEFNKKTAEMLDWVRARYEYFEQEYSDNVIMNNTV